MDAVIAALDAFEDPHGEAALAALDRAVTSLARVAHPERAIPALLGVLERFPWDDGHEVFWGLLHALEDLPGYEPALVASVRRAPGELTLVMLRRLINAGVHEVEGTDLAGLLREIAHGSPSARARECAAGLLEP